MGLSPNPEVLTWAISRCGKTPGDFKSTFPKIYDWIEGAWAPTTKQLEEFAAKTHVSLATLLSSEVPTFDLQIADYRTKPSVSNAHRTSEPSPELFDTIDHMMLRQAWMREYFSEEGHLPIDFVGQYRQRTKKNVLDEIVNKMRADLDLPIGWTFSIGTYGDAIRTFKNAAEEAGISVVINGIVNDNTHRFLSVEEFRGFVLADDIAPLVFINGKDAKSAQMFTLAHEIAHLYFATTGVVSPDIDNTELTGSEDLCDAIAAEFLVPSGSFLSFWNGSEKDEYETIGNAAKRYKVSFVVCARKARDMKLISEEYFFDYYYRHKAEIEALPDIIKKSPRGNYYNTKQYRLGNVFGQAIFAAVQSQKVSYGEAFRLTGLNANTFDAYFKGM